MKRIVLYGKSLVMSSIGASLQDCQDIQILPVDPAMPDVQHHLLTLQPDVIIFDQAVIPPDFTVRLWDAQPELVLIGLDLKNGKALLLSSLPAHVMTTEDLVQLLQRKESTEAISAGKGHQAEGI